MSPSVVAVAFLACLVALASAQSPYVHVSTFSTGDCTGDVQVYDSYVPGSCIQTGATSSLSVDCGASATGTVFSNTSDCTVSGDNTTPVDLATCNTAYASIASTSVCNTNAMTGALGDFVVRYSWGSVQANCLNDTSLTVGSPQVINPVGLQAANQLALDRCSQYNGLQWNAFSVYPTAYPNGTIKVFLYSQPGCSPADQIGFLNPEHGACGVVSGGSSGIFYETWFSSTVFGGNQPPADMSPFSFPPMGDMPPMNSPPQASAPVAAAPVAAAPVAAPVAAPAIKPPVRPPTYAPYSAALSHEAGLIGIALALFLSLLL